jgi:hypothetical protein
MYESKTDNSNYIEYYMLNAWWGNDWITVCYCRNCGILPDPVDGDQSIFKVKNDYYCESCYKNIQIAHSMRGMNWGGFLYWECLQSNPDLQ